MISRKPTCYIKITRYLTCDLDITGFLKKIAMTAALGFRTWRVKHFMSQYDAHQWCSCSWGGRYITEGRRVYCDPSILCFSMVTRLIGEYISRKRGGHTSYTQLHHWHPPISDHNLFSVIVYIAFIALSGKSPFHHCVEFKFFQSRLVNISDLMARS